MTFAELKTEVFRRLDEDSDNPAFWTEDDVAQSLNEAYEDISDSAEWYERQFNLPQLSRRTYYDLRHACGDQPVLTVRHAYNVNTSRWLTPIEVRSLDMESHYQWEDINGEPENFFRRGLFWMGVYPRQNGDTGKIKVFYTTLPVSLADDLDEPGFPQQFHYGLVEYALADLLAQEAETKRAMMHYGEYSIYEGELKSWMDGRISLDRVDRLNG